MKKLTLFTATMFAVVVTLGGCSPSDPQKTIDTMLELLQAEDIDGLTQMTCCNDNWKFFAYEDTGDAKEDYRDILRDIDLFDGIAEIVGTTLDENVKSVPDTSMKMMSGETTLKLNDGYEHTLDFNLVQVDGQWMIAGLMFR